MSSTHKKTAPESKALTIPERAAVALGYNAKTAKDLTTLAASTTHITAITNDDGYAQCHAARVALKNTRIEITRRGKAAREDAQAFAKAVIGEEQRLIALIEPEEDRLAAIQKAHDDKIAAEKQAKIDAELARVAAIETRIREIREFAERAERATCDQITTLAVDLTDLTVDESFEEFEQQAHDAYAATRARISECFKAQKAREEEAEQARKNLEELNKLRAEAAERKRQDDERAAQERRQLEEKQRQEREAQIAAEAEERGRQQAAAAAARQAEAAKQPVIAQQLSQPREIVPPISAPTDKGAPTFTGIAMPRDPSTELSLTPPPCFRPQFTEIVQIIASYYNVDRERVLEWISYLPPKASQRAA